MSKTSTFKKSLIAVTLLGAGSPVFAAESSNPVVDAITGALSGLSGVSGIIAAVAPIGIGIAIAMKVYSKGKSAVNRA
ncbi:hypothetical protein [Photobacterium leiognathi]|uniref:hypothetical protein n=1 Tax=Photobacterium leiognathi TaxID=553611 RepID=UPI00273A2AE0|nr:hypothetical protein [Photobacterium leiognathi]